ncbi:asialoglycoprotein receptor 2 [Oryctolagus cuniculus]|uniref:asialoglycoprotein receptor 2 n=1 Tax=Oryctolagus cuniculus TaxID=9986 RepID=UPI00048F3964|nr:asialoglycoprotein receptor 2 [Oryctolagus cuniculus]XP_051681255.1 asialoglycoprotein receptor 2 [Oryctolagus cuniculus]
MAKDFQDIQQLDPEESDEGAGARGQTPRREDAFWKRPPPPQSLLQRLCSQLRLALLVLGFNVLLLVAICVIAAQSARLRVELRTMNASFSNFSSSTLAVLGALGSHKGGLSDSLTALGAKLRKQQQDVKADHATLLLHLKHFPVDLRTLSCQLAFLNSNGTQCCPVNWVEHEGGCYWFSSTGKTWPEADRYCRLENAHLLVINSWDEQKFIAQHVRPFHIWIGLTDSDGSWKWVDGTDYRSNYKNWAPTQPDNWRGHELGVGEDCAEIRSDGQWNDDFCQQVHRWACEMRRNITG